MRRRIILYLLSGLLMISLVGCTKKKTVDSNQTMNTIPNHEVVDWIKDSVIYEVNIRQYTKEGTFEAFSEHLDELSDLGVNVLWFMPIYPISQEKRIGTLGSYYSVNDYTSINPEFGTEKEFKELVDNAHEMGFKIVLDWVGNHTGWDCSWITDHKEWYQTDESGNIICPPGTGWEDVAELNYENTELQSAMIDAMKYWINTYDIDGFRCDYAGGVPIEFWEKARKELDQTKKLFWLAEDNSNLNLLKIAFDANYNWKLYDTLRLIAKGGKKSTSIKYYIGNDLPEGTFPMNFLNNHDKNSYEGTILSNFGEEALPGMFVLIYTIPGIPMLYSGDEFGYDHSLEFFEKDEIIWPDTMRYQTLLKTLGNLRSQNMALYSGSYGGELQILDTQNQYVFAYTRQKDKNKVTVIINLSKYEQTVDLDECLSGMKKILLSGKGSNELIIDAYELNEDEFSKKNSMSPWEFWVLSSD